MIMPQEMTDIFNLINYFFQSINKWLDKWSHNNKKSDFIYKIKNHSLIKNKDALLNH
jgi:hypothetical protein